MKNAVETAVVSPEARGCNRFFLDFSLFLSWHQGKEKKSIEFEKLCNASASQEAFMSRYFGSPQIWYS